VAVKFGFVQHPGSPPDQFDENGTASGRYGPAIVRPAFFYSFASWVR
jgi:hypothetical protein